MYCSKCGKEIADNSKFCPECGTNIAGESSSKNTIVDETRDTRKAPIYGFQYYTREERLNPKNKKENHVWMPPWMTESMNYQLTYFPGVLNAIIIVLAIISFFLWAFSS